MKGIDGVQYLNFGEIEATFGWNRQKIYYFRQTGLLELYGSFPGDHRTYAKLADLEALKNRPPELKKRGPKVRKVIVESEVVKL